MGKNFDTLSYYLSQLIRQELEIKECFGTGKNVPRPTVFNNPIGFIQEDGGKHSLVCQTWDYNSEQFRQMIINPNGKLYIPSKEFNVPKEPENTDFYHKRIVKKLNFNRTTSRKQVINGDVSLLERRNKLL